MKKFLLKIKKLIKGKYFSSFQSIFKGAGIEIEDFRKYVPGDSTRFINWKLSAKHDEFYINLFRQEKDVELNIFFDINYNWLGGITKKNYEIVVDMFADIVVYCHENIVPIKAFLPNENFNIGKHFYITYNIVQKIKDIILTQDKTYNTKLSDFLNKAKKINKRSAIVIFSDFLGVDSDELKIIKYLADKHTLLLIPINIDNLEGQNYKNYILNHKISEIKKMVEIFNPLAYKKV